MSTSGAAPLSITLTFRDSAGGELVMGLVEPGSAPARVLTPEGVVRRRPGELQAGDLVQVPGGSFRRVDQVTRSDETTNPNQE